MKTGFTLFELLLVVVIIGIIAAAVMPRIAQQPFKTKVAAAKAFIDTQIATALRFYEMDNGVFPSTDEGLPALLIKPSSARNWRGPYLERAPLDPWGNAYGYRSPGDFRQRDYDLFSLGPDGQESADDIKNW
ncbi:MAG: type II secretion system major pseudopilin GspG [Candidatus Omnitrophota bacterium]